MANKKEKPSVCDNCCYPSSDVTKRGERKLCRFCAYPAMPGLYCVGGNGEHSVPATAMRHVSYCANLILDELKKMHGYAR